MKDESLNKNPHLGFLNNIEWMNAQASEIFISVNDRNHPELPVLSASQEWGMIYRDEGGMNIFHDVANEITYKRVRPGQFVIHLRSFQGGFAHSKVEGITSPAYTILDFKDKNKHNDLFWKYVLTSDEFIKRLELITYGIRDGRSINFSDFSTLNFYFPSYEVQQKIGTFLSHVDSLIQAKTKKLESLKTVKKSLLQKCFPKPGEKVPEMRFAGFKGEWEEKKLGEIATKVIDKNFDLSVQEVFTNSAEFGVISQRDFFDHDIANTANIDGYYVIQNEDFVYNPRISVTAPVGPINRNNLGRKGIMSPLYTIFRTKNINTLYLEWYFKTECWHDFMYLNGDSGARFDRFSIKDIVFFEMPILFPASVAEQQKIGEFFSKYDSLLSAQQKEIDKFKDIKKSLLQKMFI